MILVEDEAVAVEEALDVEEIVEGRGGGDTT